MQEIHPTYFTDKDGGVMVLLSRSDFDSLIEELEDLQDVILYDDAKKRR